MHVISISQPWAWLVVEAPWIFRTRAIVNMEWDTEFRGQVLICTSQGYDEAADDLILSKFPKIEIPSLLLRSQPFGIIGRSELANVHSQTVSSLFTGRWAFEFTCTKHINFIPFVAEKQMQEVLTIEDVLIKHKKLIKASELERIAALPDRSLYHVMNSDKRYLSNKHRLKLIEALRNIGLDLSSIIV